LCICRRKMNEVKFQTERGADVTVTADSGTVHVGVDSPAVDIENTVGRLEEHKGTDVLNLGKHRVQGDRQIIQIPVDGHKDDIEKLREESKDDSPLTYTVEENTMTTRSGGWGKQEITKQKLVASKTFTEMTEREQELSHKVPTERVPDDAEPGDVLTLGDLIDDPRTTEEKEQEALDEAAEIGEEVIVNRTTEPCSDRGKECNLDQISKIATPDGEIVTRRTHTY